MRKAYHPEIAKDQLRFLFAKRGEDDGILRVWRNAIAENSCTFEILRGIEREYIVAGGREHLQPEETRRL